MYCFKCGALNEPATQFCKNCGAALGLAEATEQTDILYTPPVQPVNAFSTLLFWGAITVVLGFFLPWVSIGGFMSFNGWTISNGLMQAGSHGRKGGGDTTLYSLMLYLMPIVSIIVVVGLFSKAGKIFFRITKLIPLIIVLSFLGIALANLKGRFEEDVLRYLSFGIYITVIGAILLALAPVKK